MVLQATGKSLSAELSAQEAVQVSQTRHICLRWPHHQPPSTQSVCVQLLGFVGRALLVETLISECARQHHLSRTDLQVRRITAV